MGLCHILDDDGRTPICVDLPTCADWFETHDGAIAHSGAIHMPSQTLVRISTIFVPFDTADPEHPRLFETMVFGGPHNHHTERYTTWQEARMGHERVVRAILMGMAP